VRAAAALAALLVLSACSSAVTPSGSALRSAPSSAAPQPAESTAAVTSPDWPTYHGNKARSGYASAMPTATTLRLIAKPTLDGQVYGSPIVVRGITVVATENNSVYAFDASLRQLWKRNLGTPARRSELPCGNIDPLGITGTPAYDGGTGYVFVAPELGGPPRHQLVALRLSDGSVAWRRSLDLTGVDRTAMQQRGALTVTGGRVWVPFGGLAGDCGNYKGRIIGDPVGGVGANVNYTVPTAREAGMWTPPGPSVDSSGYLYVSVGNGAATSSSDGYDHSDSVLKLSPSTARVVSYFAPRSWASDNAADLDLGSQGPALVGPWVFIAGKSGTAYVLERSALGGIGGQVSSAAVCRSFGGTAVVGSTVYVPCTDGVRAVRIDSTGHLHVLWHAASGTAGSPVAGGGRVFALDQGAGVLHALDPASGASRAALAVGAVSRFATPAVSGDRLIVPTLTGITVVGVR
jgi:hypothetical protein